MKTQDEIEELKRQWLADPIWDVEVTEGFEEHRDELLAFRTQIESRNHYKEMKRRDKRCEDLGIHCNHDLLLYLERLERRIDALERE